MKAPAAYLRGWEIKVQEIIPNMDPIFDIKASVLLRSILPLGSLVMGKLKHLKI